MPIHQRRRAKRLPQYDSDAYRKILDCFAANVRGARKIRGWTQKEAAVHCGMAPQQFQRTEAGAVNLTFTTLARICEGFGVEARDLFEPAAPRAKRKTLRPKKAPAVETLDDKPSERRPP